MMIKNPPFSAHALVVALLLTSCADRPAKQTEFDFVVVADTAYKVPEDYAGYDKLISRINQEDSIFTIHLGDVFGGQTDCGDTNILRVKEDFAKYNKPVVYTPGDNEWTDCHNEASGGYKPIERLANIRRLFFGNEYSLGQERMALKAQSNPDVAIPENRMWQQGDVLFATLHIVGSNNGLTVESGQGPATEFSIRNEANTRWLKHIFERAAEQGAEALVLAYHASMFTEPATPDGVGDVRGLIGRLGEGFGKPVLLVHGDHHQFVVDRPYLSPLTKAPGEKIMRLQTFGWPDAKAVKIHVDTSTEATFTFKPIFDGDGFY